MLDPSVGRNDESESRDETVSEHTEAVKAAAEYLAEWAPRCSHENPTDMLWLADHVVAVADRFGGGMTKEQLRGEVVFLNRIITELRDAARDVVEAWEEGWIGAAKPVGKDIGVLTRLKRVLDA